jgi:hypothetical protein
MQFFVKGVQLSLLHPWRQSSKVCILQICSCGFYARQTYVHTSYMLNFQATMSRYWVTIIMKMEYVRFAHLESISHNHSFCFRTCGSAMSRFEDVTMFRVALHLTSSERIWRKSGPSHIFCSRWNYKKYKSGGHTSKILHRQIYSLGPSFYLKIVLKVWVEELSQISHTTQLYHTKWYFILDKGSCNLKISL